MHICIQFQSNSKHCCSYVARFGELLQRYTYYTNNNNNRLGLIYTDRPMTYGPDQTDPKFYEPEFCKVITSFSVDEKHQDWFSVNFYTKGRNTW